MSTSNNTAVLETRRSFRLGIGASVTDNLGAALTWTGLPLYVATITGDARQLAWLFTAQTLAGLIMSFFAGNLTDSFSATTLIVSCSVCVAVFLVVVFLLFGKDDIWPFYALGILNAVATAIASNALRVWLGSLIPADDLATWLGKRGVWLSGSKLAGTAFGPILFSALGKNALLISAVLVLLGGFLYFAAVRGSSTRAPRINNPDSRVRQLVAGWSEVRASPVLARMLFVQASVALLGIPLTALLLELLYQIVEGDSPYFSAFWAIGFGGSILANTVLALGFSRRLAPKGVLLAGFTIAAISMVVMVLSNVPVLFLGLFLIVVFSRTVLGITVFATIFPSISKANRGRVIGVNDFVADGLALIGLILLSTISPEFLVPFALAYLALLLVVFLAGATRLPKQIGRMTTEGEIIESNKSA